MSYLELMTVRPEERGSGVGAALVAEFLRIAEASGVGVTLLHHDQVNPLSGPFWSQRGYRPLCRTGVGSPPRPAPSADRRPSSSLLAVTVPGGAG